MFEIKNRYGATIATVNEKEFEEIRKQGLLQYGDKIIDKDNGAEWRIN